MAFIQATCSCAPPGTSYRVLGRSTITSSSGALTIEGIFKSSGLETSKMIDVHEYSKRLENARRRLGQLRHSDLLLAFIDHLLALGLLSENMVAKIADINEDDFYLIEKLSKEFSEYFNPNVDLRKIMESKFTKIVPLSHRLYGKLYG
jgi:hypothetical protein